MSVPLSLESLLMLYQSGSDAKVGVEGQGDVLDNKRRKTKEYNAADIQLPSALRNFEFPEEAEEISVIDPSSGEKKAGYFWRGDGSGGDLVLYSRRHMGDPSTTQNLDNAEQLLGDLCGALSDEEGFVVRLGMNDEGSSGDAVDSQKYALRFAAWLGDVPHEVKPLNQGFRVVLIYRLLKQGEKELVIPRRTELDIQVHQLFGILKKPEWANRTFAPDLTGPDSEEDDEDEDDESEGSGEEEEDVPAPDLSFQAKNLGIILRHAYPPGGLQPNALKGIDAVAYELFSRDHRCYIRPAFECRWDVYYAPFRLQKENEYASEPDEDYFLLRQMFDSAAVSVNLTNESPHERQSRIDMLAQEKVIMDCLWIQLGFGSIAGGGICYGNCDCPTDWWYRQAVMIVTQEPSFWERRRGAFYLGLYGSPSMQWLYSVWDVFEQVVVFL